jgi:acyl-CoA reductase-like NAD-dependent aldehyde dehydrogenase
MAQAGFSPEGVHVKHPGEVWIGGKWRAPHSGRFIELVSPNSEQVVGAVAEADEADMDDAVAAAREAFDHGPWPRMSAADRNEVMKKIEAHLRTREPELAKAWTAQMGGLATFAPGMVAGSTIQFQQIREAGASYAYVQERDTPAAGKAYIVAEPVGVVAAIAPWNAPYGLMATKLAYSLITGCTVIMKPSPETPLEAYIIAEACEAAGLPAGVANLVCGHREAADHMVNNPGIDKVSFTGSTAAGKRIAQVMGGRIGRYTLELGGKSAAIVRDDFTAEQTAKLMAGTITLLSGQVCAMLTRLIVPKARHDEITEALATEFEKIKIGYSDDPTTQLGPLAMKRQLERVEMYIEEGKKTADLVTGGNRPSQFNQGYFIEPTLFANVDNKSRIAQEEIFGPVLSVIPVEDEEEAIAVANDSSYGLSGAVLTNDAQAAYDVARRIRTGGIAQNGLKVDWELPFGGYKQSGVGREGGIYGLTAYLETKTMYMDEPVVAA